MLIGNAGNNAELGGSGAFAAGTDISPHNPISKVRTHSLNFPEIPEIVCSGILLHYRAHLQV